MYKPVISILILFCSGRCIAQVAGEDNREQDADHIIASYYQQSAGGGLPLYNGIRHDGYRPDFKGHAYFEKDWKNGTVYYAGALYQEIPMLYDEVTDELVVRHPEHQAAISIVSENVSQFILSGHTFINLSEDSGLPPGFYDLLYAGNTSVLVKRKKISHEQITTQGINREFIVQNRYYLKKGNAYLTIRNMKGLLNVLGEKKKELKTFLNNSEFKTDWETVLVQAAEHYDKLTGTL